MEQPTQQQTQIEKPVQTTKITPSQTTKTTPPQTPSSQVQGKPVNVPKKSSKGWLWLLLGFVLGAVGMWAALSL